METSEASFKYFSGYFLLNWGVSYTVLPINEYIPQNFYIFFLQTNHNSIVTFLVEYNTKKLIY